RADYDQAHAFKTSVVYELPVGTGHRLLAGAAGLNRLASGWMLSSILVWRSGTPFSIVSGRGTLNRSGRSDQNTAISFLNGGDLKSLIGVVKTSSAIYFIKPRVIGPDGRGVAPDGAAPFDGQVFFDPDPGAVGSLQRRMFNGAQFWNWD